MYDVFRVTSIENQVLAILYGPLVMTGSMESFLGFYGNPFSISKWSGLPFLCQQDMQQFAHSEAGQY